MVPDNALKASRQTQRPIRHPISSQTIHKTQAVGEASVERTVDVEELRRARTSFYENPDRPGQTSPLALMAEEETRPRRRDSTRKSVKASVVTVRQVDEAARPKHRRRHRKSSKEEDGEDEEDSVYVYRSVGGAERKRRSTATLVERGSQPQARSTNILGGRGRILRSLGLELRQPTSNNGRRAASDEPMRRRLSSATLDTRGLPDADNWVDVNAVKSPSSSSRPQVRRSTSLRETSSRSAPRPSLTRSQTTKQRARAASTVMPTVPEDENEETTAVPAPSRKPERTNSVLGTLFGPSRSAAPQRRVECLTCMSDDVPISQSAKLACGHRMCHECLQRIFTMSVTDPAHMPPKCCTSDHIPLKHVDRLFDDKFKMKWNRKYQEYTTKNRIYCPSRGCGEWIKPSHIHLDTSGGLNGGRKYGKCGRCKTKVCVTCNGKWHTSRECPKDEATARFAEIAEKEGWQRCYNCSAMVELKEGCNHMTCRCRAQFCMICGLKWKSCDCPWFNYQAVENDRLQNLGVAQARNEAGRGGMQAPMAYQEQLDRRRQQERYDEDLARRLQGLGLGNNLGQDLGGLLGLGNAAGQIFNVDFVQRAAVMLLGNQNAAHLQAADRLMANMRGENPRQAQQAPIPPPPPPAIPAREPANVRRPIQRRHAQPAASRRVATGTAARSSRRAPSPRAPVTTGPAEMAGLRSRTTQGRVATWARHVAENETPSS